MGSPPDDRDNYEDELPLHPVRITRDFSMGATKVTRGQFEQVVEEEGYKTDAEMAWDEKTWRNNSYKTQDAQPVVYVSWRDAVAFCEWLRRKEGKYYDLPTDALATRPIVDLKRALFSVSFLPPPR